MNGRRGWHRWLLFACVAIVGSTTFVRPRVGVCGTAHFFLLRMLGGEIVNALAPRRFQFQAVAFGAALLLNVAVFFAGGITWYLKGPRAWYVVGLLVWTGLYLLSYFFFAPVPDCP